MGSVFRSIWKEKKLQLKVSELFYDSIGDYSTLFKRYWLRFKQNVNPLNHRSTSCFLEVEEETVKLLPLQRVQVVLFLASQRQLDRSPFPQSYNDQQHWTKHGFILLFIMTRSPIGLHFPGRFIISPQTKLLCLKRKSTFPLHRAINIYIKIFSIASSDVEIQVNHETVCFIIRLIYWL